MPRENLWKFGVIAAALGGAAVISFFSWSSDAAPPDDGGRVTYWSCAECSRGFQLSIDEFKAAKAAGDTSRAAGPMTRQSGAFETVRCAGCGKVAAVTSSMCTVHNVIYPTRAQDGARGRCPECAEDF